MTYHSLYGENNYVFIWGDWLSCDPHRGSHDSQIPHIWGDCLSCDPIRGSHDPITPYKEALVPHPVATLLFVTKLFILYKGL